MLCGFTRMSYEKWIFWKPLSLFFFSSFPRFTRRACLNLVAPTTRGDPFRNGNHVPVTATTLVSARAEFKERRIAFKLGLITIPNQTPERLKYLAHATKANANVYVNSYNKFKEHHVRLLKKSELTIFALTVNFCWIKSWSESVGRILRNR
ncbi:hypothetical protein AGABI2DRAFT_195929, partial [Agaricus bisporus var. bisporus H97]|uniref:hypothetical protein n=1 Tax=Agaricus bisporus var. bisporus (strain H97 / ATCC MYA-4626 / FGSC 10389) TaxID=936046 RepID=UPI00029F676E